MLDGFDLSLALEGNLQEMEEELRYDVRVAMRKALFRAGEFGKERVRAHCSSLPGYGHAWDFAMYPPGYNQLADNPACVIFPKSNAEPVIRAHAFGAVITANGAMQMWIPIPDSPADRRAPRGRDIVEYIISRVGWENIGFIPATPHRPAMAVAREASITSRGNVGRGGRALLKSGRRRKGTADVPLFYLVPQVTLTPSINPQAGFDETERAFPTIMAQALAEELGRRDTR